MSPKKLLSFVFCLCVLTGLSQEPTDCINSVVVCGNSNVNLDVGGIGTQELNGTNTCSSQENNSIWLRVSVVTSGTMGFILTPTSNAISEDYDFFVFGPNVSCGNIGQAIRCSTTNPMAAGQGNNRTGMDGNSNDTSEGPGPDGNSFVRWIDAEVGDSYFIVIDRPLGNSSFSLEWIGTATFAEPPQNQVSAGNSIDLERCDVSMPFDDGLTEFDLSLNTNSIIGSQNDVEVSYHLSESDANIGDNPLDTDYTSIANPQTIFYRITSTITNCFDIGSFELVASLGPDFNDVGTYRVCDNTDDGNDSDGRTTFDLDGLKSQYVSATDLSNVTITYHRSIDDAENRRNAVNENYYNSTPNQEELFVRIEDNFNQQCRSLTRLQLVVDPLPIANAARLIQCDEDGILDGKTFYNLREIESDITDGVPDVSVSYFLSLADAESDTEPIDATRFENNQNPQTVYAKVSDNQTQCFRVAPIVLAVSLTSVNNAQLKLCDDNVEDGIQTFQLQDASATVVNGLGSDLEISYYESYESALLETLPLPNAYTNSIPFAQTIFARVENANACFGISEVELIVFERPQIEVNAQKIYCLNFFPETITLSAGLLDNQPSNYRFEWSTGETDPIIEVDAPGIYTVEVINANGCSKIRKIDVRPSNIATFETIEIQDASSNNTVVVSVSGEGNYVYALDNDRLPFQESNRFEDVRPGFHTVFVRDLNGCGSIDRVISVVGFPKFFTPNNDGFNDFWKIEGINTQFQANSTLKIFNRFGKLLKEANPLSGWDGRFKGQLLPSDDYWFSATLEDGREFTGHFTLKR